MQESGKLQLSAVVEKYLRYKVLRPLSQKAYRGKAQRLIVFLGHDPLIQAITQDQLLDFRDHVLSQCRAATWNILRRHLQPIFRFAVQMQWMSESPLNGIKPLTLDQSGPRRVSLDVLETVLTELRSGRLGQRAEPRWFWECVVLMFAQTGMRLNQLLGLNWGDIDFRQKTIRLRAESSKTRREWSVPMSDVLYEPLLTLRHQCHRKADSAVAEGSAVFNRSLFPSKLRTFAAKERMSRDQVSAFFNQVHVCTGLRVTSHRIRHTVGSETMRVVGNPKIVQNLLGHANIATTMIYVHIDLDDVRSAINRSALHAVC